MKSKRRFVLSILWMISIVLSGCTFKTSSNDQSSTQSSSQTYDVQALERVFEKYRDATAINMTYTTTIDTNGTTVGFTSDMIVQTTGDQPFVYMKTTSSSQYSIMYFVDGYLYSEIDADYTIIETNDLPDDSPILSDLNLTAPDDFSSKVEYNDVIYTLVFTGEKIKPYIEEILGEQIIDLEITMTLEVRVVKSTDQLKTMKMNFTIGDVNEPVLVEVLAVFRAFGYQVTNTVPTLILNRIEQYKSDPDFEPAPNHYEDTLDHVVKYHDFEPFNKIVYDEETNQLIIIKNHSIEIYDASTLTLKRSISSLLQPTNLDADHGKLVVTYKTNHFKIYDLTQDIAPITVQTEIDVAEIVIDQDMVIYASYDQWCSIVFHNIKTDEKQKIYSIYNPKLTLNRNDHILYVTETGLSSSLLVYYNSQTGEELYKSDFSQYEYINERITYDGKFVHHDGKTFNRYDASTVSLNEMNRVYPPFNEFTPSKTLYEAENVSFVGGTNYQIGVYDNSNNTFVYQFKFNGSQIITLQDGKYLVIGDDQKYIAIVDVKLISEDLVNDTPVEQPINTVVVSEDGKLQTLKSSMYTHSVVDGNYLYSINDNSYELNVYDIRTLEKVYQEVFLIKPVSIDASNGRFVIGYGDSNQFRIYNATTWESEIIPTVDPVYSTVIYKDEILYAQVDQHCSVRVYNITTKTHSYLGYSGYYITMAINHKDGIIYFGDRNSSGCDLAYYNLETKQRIFIWDCSYKGTKVQFDGNFVHYAYKVFDKNTGITISNSEIARQYQTPSITKSKTIYDDDKISIFIGKNLSGETVTVVYDLVTNTELYTLIGDASHAYIVENTIVILNNAKDTVRTLNLNE